MRRLSVWCAALLARGLMPVLMLGLGLVLGPTPGLAAGLGDGLRTGLTTGLKSATPLTAQEAWPPEVPMTVVLPPPWPQPPPPGQAESLPDLLSRVLQRDPQVRVARSLLQASEERRRQARSRLGPTVSVSGTQGTGQELEFGRQIERRTDRAEASVRWNLYNYGNDRAELAGAERDLLAGAQAVRQAREEVAERVAEAYAELLRVESLLPRAAARLAAVRRLVEQVQRQAELGKVSDADAQQAQASLLDAEIAHEQLVSDHESARQRLAALVGGEVRPVLPLPLRLAGAPGAGPSTATEVPTVAAVVAAASERAAAARVRVRPLVSLLAPRIDFEYRQRLSGRTAPQPTTEPLHGWLLTARWDFPVGGEFQARRAENERRAEAVEAEAERVLQGVESERATLPPRIANAERAVLQLERQIEQFNALLRAGELQFEAGRRTLAQLVQLHDSRYNAEQRRAEQAHRLLGAQLRQLALNGGLLPALGQPLE